MDVVSKGEAEDEAITKVDEGTIAEEEPAAEEEPTTEEEPTAEEERAAVGGEEEVGEDVPKKVRSSPLELM